MPDFKKTGLVSHGFSTRVGGTGTKPYDTLNLAFHVGDDPAAVVRNRETVCRVLGAKIENIVTAQQVHGVNIAVVDSSHAGAGAFNYDSAIPGTDGLITDVPELVLATFYADCVPIFILDPVKKVIASVHAGWKGTVAGIGECAVKKMTEIFGTDPAHCLAGIGPSIGPCCYEVDEPVIRCLQERYVWWPDVLEYTGGGRARLNLWEANRKVMVGAGIMTDNVELASTCTCCNPEMLFSYRGSGGVTGRMGAFVMLRSDNM